MKRYFITWLLTLLISAGFSYVNLQPICVAYNAECLMSVEQSDGMYSSTLRIKSMYIDVLTDYEPEYYCDVYEYENKLYMTPPTRIVIREDNSDYSAVWWMLIHIETLITTVVFYCITFIALKEERRYEESVSLSRCR